MDFFAVWIFFRTEISPYGVFAVIFDLRGFMVFSSFLKQNFSSAEQSQLSMTNLENWTYYEIKNNLVFILFRPALPVYGAIPTWIYTYIEKFGRDEWSYWNVFEIEFPRPVRSSMNAKILLTVRLMWFWLVMVSIY